MLFPRLLQVYARSRRQPPITSLNETTSQFFRVLPTDLDNYLHMHHSKYFIYLEAARLAVQMRAGFLKLALKEKWIAPVAKVEIYYYKSLKLGQEFEVKTRFVGTDAKFIYVHHEIHSRHKMTTQALLRVAVRGKQGIVSPKTYLETLNFFEADFEVPPSIGPWLERFKEDPVAIPK